MINTLLFIPLGAGVLSLLFAIYRTIWVKRQNPGDAKLQEIGKAIRDGAMAFLAREYKILLIIVVAVGALLVLGGKGAGRLHRCFIFSGCHFFRACRVYRYGRGDQGQYANCLWSKIGTC